MSSAFIRSTIDVRQSELLLAPLTACPGSARHRRSARARSRCGRRRRRTPGRRGGRTAGRCGSGRAAAENRAHDSNVHRSPLGLEMVRAGDGVRSRLAHLFNQWQAPDHRWLIQRARRLPNNGSFTKRECLTRFGEYDGPPAAMMGPVPEGVWSNRHGNSGRHCSVPLSSRARNSAAREGETTMRPVHIKAVLPRNVTPRQCHITDRAAATTAPEISHRSVSACPTRIAHCNIRLGRFQGGSAPRHHPVRRSIPCSAWCWRASCTAMWRCRCCSAGRGLCPARPVCRCSAFMK